MRVRMQLNSTGDILCNHGLDAGGHVQQFWTGTVLRRMQRYMPYRSAQMIRQTIAHTDLSTGLIVTDTPGARMLYHGKVMIDPETGIAGFLTDDGWKSRKGSKKVVTNRNIAYTTTKNPKAGPYWDRRLVAAEMRAMAQELQAYINQRR